MQFSKKHAARVTLISKTIQIEYFFMFVNMLLKPKQHV
jgi:hypothetical protein